MINVFITQPSMTTRLTALSESFQKMCLEKFKNSFWSSTISSRTIFTTSPKNDYIFVIQYSIFNILVPFQRGMNSLQKPYLELWGTMRNKNSCKRVAFLLKNVRQKRRLGQQIDCTVTQLFYSSLYLKVSKRGFGENSFLFEKALEDQKSCIE